MPEWLRRRAKKPLRQGSLQDVQTANWKAFLPYWPLYWADGEKTVWEIACLCAMEEGKDDYTAWYEECLCLMRALSESGIVRMEKV